ncbi:hypothetical protein V8F44DRAFT_611455 [Aspergillus fumigatus]
MPLMLSAFSFRRSLPSLRESSGRAHNHRPDGTLHRDALAKQMTYSGASRRRTPIASSLFSSDRQRKTRILCHLGLFYLVRHSGLTGLAQ